MDKVLILDFGSQYTQLIARRVREMGVFSLILPFDASLERIKKENPRALIFSGGPQSVYESNASMPDKRLFQAKIPILGICYGAQLMAHLLGGKVLPSSKREYGFASLRILRNEGILREIDQNSQVWMSHGDLVGELPEGFFQSGGTDNCRAAVIEDPSRNFFGVQFHPEVIHTEEGQKLLANFLFEIARLKPDWTMESFVEKEVREIRAQVGSGRVICGLSGGIDSLVTALLVHKAIGDNLICVVVDNGLLRTGQFRELTSSLKKLFYLNVVGVEASQYFLERLKGVVSPEKKRKIIGEAFIKIFEEEANKIGQVDFLAQGTIYPDVIESTPVKGPSSSIKSHHNVGGLPGGLMFKLIEPLRDLFKDEVRRLAEEMGIPREFVSLHPFPGPGLAVRVIGEVTPERLDLLRQADDLLLQEIKTEGIHEQLWQAFAVLLPVKSVGVMGDKRTYQSVAAIRLIQSVDGMTADWYPASPKLLARISNRIINEVDGVNRVVYDITSKPPGTIEWE